MKICVDHHEYEIWCTRKFKEPFSLKSEKPGKLVLVLIRLQP
jgi:hypothetical protein